MGRSIFRVEAWVVDANGTFNTLSGYPKNFDSNNYEGDEDKALRRATGDFSEAWGAMCKRDDRKLQTVILLSSNGMVLERRTVGTLDEDSLEPEPIEE